MFPVVILSFAFSATLEEHPEKVWLGRSDRRDMGGQEATLAPSHAQGWLCFRYRTGAQVVGLVRQLLGFSSS